MPTENIDKRFKYLLYSRAFRSVAIIYMSLAFSLYLAALHVGIIEIGIVSALAMLFMVFLTLVLGLVGDRHGYKTELLCAEFIALAGALIIGVSSAPVYIMAGMVIAGLGGGAGGMRGAFSPGTNAFIANNYSDQKDRIRRYSHITLVGSVASIGGSILFASVSPLSGFVGLMNSYRILFIISAVMLVASLSSITMLTEERRPHKTTMVMKRSSINYSARVIAANILGGMGVGLVIPLLPLWLALSYEATSLDIGIVFTALYLAVALGSYLSSRVAHKMDMLNVAAYTRLLSGALLFAMAFSPTLIAAALLYILRGMLAGFGSPSRTAVNVRGIDAEDYGAATSVQGIAARAGQLSSGLSGYLMDYSLPLPIFIGGALQLASGVSYKLLFNKRKR
ncbi:MAG: MFS transporter [Candidatus Micrarchaeota archaeon]|nr:MFS transporter [Candidatus Micrarchaeota archaeon]MDE1834295.1 MFS transporter [Candidatus Micrarchaeota archaeon]